jgi:hypothetical protein
LNDENLCPADRSYRLPRGFPTHAEVPETPHLQFVSTYIQQLGAIEKIRNDGENELKADGAAGFLPDCIRNMTKYQLELSVQISTLASMHLNPPFDRVTERITDFYNKKLDFYKLFGQTCSAFIAGPKANVDYGELAAAAPKINAQIEFIDQSLFKASPLVFATLIDQREDAHGHVSHLIITKAERAKLIRKITSEFGDKLKQDNQNYTVGAASMLKSYLEKDFKSSDEPWN